MKTDTIIPPPPEVSSTESSAVGLPARTGGGSSRLIDLTRHRFGRWVVLSRAENARDGKPRWNVKCDCGKLRAVHGSSLHSGTTLSCGCYRDEQVSRHNLINLAGQRFGRLVVVSRAENPGKKHTRWAVICDCGEKRVVHADNLRSGHTTSCGCLKREQRGDKSPHWNPKLTQKDRDRRRHGTPTYTTYTTVAQKVRRRDRATCLVCSAPRSTQVHHLEPWATAHDLRYDPANLVTLCKECHYQFHKLYGHDADLEDFEDYLTS
jgi:5-methylcytosine-specific restriction endonuclease McrA